MVFGTSWLNRGQHACLSPARRRRIECPVRDYTRSGRPGAVRFGPVGAMARSRRPWNSETSAFESRYGLHSTDSLPFNLIGACAGRDRNPLRRSARSAHSLSERVSSAGREGADTSISTRVRMLRYRANQTTEGREDCAQFEADLHYLGRCSARQIGVLDLQDVSQVPESSRLPKAGDRSRTGDIQLGNRLGVKAQRSQLQEDTHRCGGSQCPWPLRAIAGLSQEAHPSCGSYHSAALC